MSNTNFFGGIFSEDQIFPGKSRLIFYQSPRIMRIENYDWDLKNFQVHFYNLCSW